MSDGSILIIEDSIDIRSLLAEYFNDSGFDISTAGSAEDAWALIQRKNFDLIISDIGLPGIDGDELLEKMRQNDVKTSVVLIAGVDINKGMVDLAKYDNCQFVQKPFDLNKLGEIIRASIKSGQIPQKTKANAKS